MNTSRTQGNQIWHFLSSVRLAVFLLITLAVTCIIGTLIPQGEPFPQFYLERYGSTAFQFIRILDLNDAYHAWWFLSLLSLFSVNLIVCTLRRLPFMLDLYRRDSLDVDAGRLERMPLRRQWVLKGPQAKDAQQEVVAAFEKHAGTSLKKRSEVNGETLFLAEHGKWSYWGVYALHGSVLIIFAGAIMGFFLGFKGSVMLTEGETTDYAIQQNTGQTIPLEFSVRCDRFTVSFYDTGAPKEFRSDLTILNDGHDVLHKTIRVNDPLTYRGITFYQASYQTIPHVTLRILTSDGRQETLGMPAFKRVMWKEGGAALGVIQYLPNVHGSQAARISWTDQTGPGEAVWVLKGREKELQRGSNLYRLSLVEIKERYMTGLQVKQDPGVWLVWLGCTGLILGFVVVFWVGHRRMWLWIGPQDGRIVVWLAGQGNKNRIGLEKDFAKIATKLDRSVGEQP